MGKRTAEEEEDQQLSDMTNSFIFMVLLICIASWSGYHVYKRNQEQQECRQRGGRVVSATDDHTMFQDDWRCLMEDRD